MTLQDSSRYSFAIRESFAKLFESIYVFNTMEKHAAAPTTAETLTVASLEDFVSESEKREIISCMDTLFAVQNRHMFSAGRKTTLHEVPGRDPAFAQEVYEPFGRLEVHPVPAPVSTIMENATHRAFSHVKRLTPSVQEVRPWTYVEYGLGQYITPHIDRVAPSINASPFQILGISVTLDDNYEGGEFYVETTGSNSIWSNERADNFEMVHEGSDFSSDWFRAFPRTRWTARPRSGSAVLYGTHVTHGTLPVTRGTVRKLISWFSCPNPQFSQ